MTRTYCLTVFIVASFLTSRSYQNSHGISFLAEQLDQYCSITLKKQDLPKIHNVTSCPCRVGKAGPRGPPGLTGATGAVNYTVVNELITNKFNEFMLEEKIDFLVSRACDRPEDRRKPKNCLDVQRENAKIWNETGGVFDIYPGESGRKVEVYCDLTTDGGGWMVFQRRMDGAENFQRPWADYVKGFGRKEQEFWLGLETLHRLIRYDNYDLRIDLEDWESQTVYAMYTEFSIRSSRSKYLIDVQGYSGTSGNSLTYHNGAKFTTFDQDNDESTTENCAANHGGGWWYKACDRSQLNGLYYKGGEMPGPKEDGVEWHDWKGTGRYSMKFVEMKIRPKL